MNEVRGSDELIDILSVYKYGSTTYMHVHKHLRIVKKQSGS